MSCKQINWYNLCNAIRETTVGSDLVNSLFILLHGSSTQSKSELATQQVGILMKACLAGKLQEEKKIVKVQQQIKIEKNAINLQNRKRVCPGIFASALVVTIFEP